MPVKLTLWWKFFTILTFRSIHWRCSVKKNVLRNFAKFTGKHLCQSLFFNNFAGLRPVTLLEKRLWHRCFGPWKRFSALQTSNTLLARFAHSQKLFWLCFIFWLCWMKLWSSDQRCSQKPTKHPRWNIPQKKVIRLLTIFPKSFILDVFLGFEKQVHLCATWNHIYNVICSGSRKADDWSNFKISEIVWISKISKTAIIKISKMKKIYHKEIKKQWLPYVIWQPYYWFFDFTRKLKTDVLLFFLWTTTSMIGRHGSVSSWIIHQNKIKVK